jgi:hypothetical protein
MINKKCTRCKQEKPIIDFNKDKNSRDGHARWCRQCCSNYNKQRKDNLEHIEIETKICSFCNIEKSIDEFYTNQWHEDGHQPWCKECSKEEYSRYYARNTTRIKKVHRLWQQNNPEKYKECMDAYYNSPAGKLSEKQAKKKRREIMKQLPNTFTKEEWDQCKEYFNHSCAYCESTNKIQKDHFVSVLNYGPTTKENIVVACNKCNPSKGDFDFFQWYPGQLFYSQEREEKIIKYLGI